MNRFSHIIFNIVAVFFCVFANAQDSALLESLVEKSILTPEEALQIKKESVEVLPTENSPAKKLSFSGRLQTQYFMISADDGLTSDTISALQLRRVYFGTNAIFSDTLKANITLDLLSATSSTHKLVKLYVEKKFDVDFAYGDVKTGFLADNFSYEAVSTSKSLLTIERSIASRYFAGSYSNFGKYGYSGYGSIEFGGESMGVYLHATPRNAEKLDIGFAITSPQTYTIRPPNDGRNIPAFWLNAKYRDSFDFADDVVKLELGVYTGLKPQGSVEMSHKEDVGTMCGVNPFFKITSTRLTVWSDFLFVNMQYGKADMQYANIFGTNIATEYRFDIGDFGKLAPAFRFAYLDTDGRGCRISDCSRRGPNLYSDFTQYYNNALSLYFGLNWYIDSDNLKIQLGYERYKFWGEVNNNNARNTDANSLRAMLQIVF